MSLDSAPPPVDGGPKQRHSLGNDPDCVARSVAAMIERNDIAVVALIGFPGLVADIATRVSSELGLSVEENIVGSLYSVPEHWHMMKPEDRFITELLTLTQKRHRTKPLLWVGDLSWEWQRDHLLRALRGRLDERRWHFGQVPGTLAVHLRRSLKRGLSDGVDPFGEIVHGRWPEQKLHHRIWAEERFRRLQNVNTSDLRDEGFSAAVEFGF